MRGNLFARLLQLRDRLLTRLVQIAKVGLQALAALALFAAEDELEPGMFTLAECGIKLCGKVALLRIALALQFSNRRVHLVDLLIQLGKGVLRFTEFTRGSGDGLFLLLKLGEQGGALLLLLAYRTLFGGDIGLNGFQLVAVIRVGRCGAQQYASAECAGAKQGSD